MLCLKQFLPGVIQKQEEESQNQKGFGYLTNIKNNLKMKKNLFFTLIIIFIGFSINSYAIKNINQKAEKNHNPNLVIVFVDQMRGSAMGFLGEEPVFTPCIDEFAKESLVLTDAVSNYPVCSPTRASLMTGKYPFSHGVVRNCYSKPGMKGVELKSDEICWSDVLKLNGYNLGYIGKWHLDDPYEPYIECANNRGSINWNEWCPPERRHGFDFWYAYGTYDDHMKPLYWKGDAKRDEFHYVDEWGPEHEANLAIKYIKNIGEKYRDSKKPFALVVAMNPPHTPYHLVPDKYKELYEKVPIEELVTDPNIPVKGSKFGDLYRKNIKDYYAMISGVDEQFGKILDELDASGLSKNTIVLFTSDHGDNLGIHNEKTKNNHFEESMVIPFIVRWPDKIKPGQDNLLLSTPDIYPTLIDLMGYKPDIPDDVEGISHASVFLTGSGFRPESQLYVKNPLEGFDRRGVRTHQYTLMVPNPQDEGSEIELYDRIADPFQLQNIARENPDIVQEMRQKMEVWLEKTNDPWLK